MITNLDQAMEQNSKLVEETFRVTTLYQKACEHIQKLEKNGVAAMDSQIMQEMESLKKENAEMKRDLDMKGEVISVLTQAMHNNNKDAANEIQDLKNKIAELEKKAFVPNDGTEISLLKTELNEKNLQLAAITEQFLITAKCSRDAQQEVQKLIRERLLLFDHIKKTGYIDGASANLGNH